ncbi:SLBB domain-containing protein [Nodosilinea sp. LEGE 07088]|uniref:polysaccharide biosynthesis/export family protein n=1 Tax=Nodosilinea sp. LEGE 07088 TaxID=2777968 RepID=UPI0018804898|nr:SLBB domain-containing protein [Nodosilinea sp. LEGE 07088]MBE9139575.1 SLBB domain-containing protein [Nodosilinea sp. LEGE 07088]
MVIKQLGQAVGRPCCLPRQLLALAFLGVSVGVAAPAFAAADFPLPQAAMEYNLTAQGRGVPSVDERYTLGPGDQLALTVFMATQYDGTYEVVVDGTLNLPGAGSVMVGGLTMEAATAAVSNAYASRLRRPIVTLSLVTPRPLRIGVGGEVSQPGAYTLTREGTQFPTLIRALELAGGVTQLADIRQVEIQRLTQDGISRTVTIDLWEFLQTGNIGYDLTLRDGDSILVPTVEQFDRVQSAQTNAASFASSDSESLNVAVVGEVFRPGPHTVTGTTQTTSAGLQGQATGSAVLPTVTRAIQVAGGIKPDADVRGVQVFRRTRGGDRQEIDVNLWNLLQTGDLSEDIILQEGDTVYVPTATTLLPSDATELAAASFSPNSIRINVVGEVATPGPVEVPPNTPLNQGLLAAGGFNNRARKIDVELIRLNPDGTVSRRSLPIDFAAGVNEANNPGLRNNDVIIVNRSAAATVGDALDNVATPLGRALTLFTVPATLLQLFD